jgi:hypothetical protein
MISDAREKNKNYHHHQYSAQNSEPNNQQFDERKVEIIINFL